MLRERTENMQIEPAVMATPLPALAANYAVSEVLDRPGDTAGLNQLTSALWLRKATIAGASVLGLLIGLSVSVLTPPSYRAHTSLQLEGFTDDTFLRGVTPISPQLPNASAENYLQNQVKLLESRTLASRVASKLGIQPEDRKPGAVGALIAQFRDQVSFLRPWPKTLDERRIEKVVNALTVRTSLQSQVIELSYDAADPNFAARGANTTATEFMDLNREVRSQLVRDTTDWLGKQAKDLKGKLESSNRQLQGFARANGLVFAGKHSTLAEDRMRQIQEALSKAEADRAAKQSRYEANMADSGGATDSLAPGPLREYQVNLQNMRRELAQLRTQYTPAHYKVLSLSAQIAETETAIENERKQILSRIRNEYVAGAGLERLLSESHTRQLKTVEQQMDKERQYDVLKSEIDTTQKLYDIMLQRAGEAGAASALRSTNVRVIDTAKAPSVPYSPKTPLNLAIGFALGALGGIGLVLVGGRSVKVSEPGESLPNVPELGVIPAASDARDPAKRGLIRFRPPSCESGLVTWDKARPLWSESFRGALTSILFSADLNRGPRSGVSGVRGRVLMIASIEAMEGKTTVLANLGIAAAERKQRVLLIDADLRRPRLHELFNLSNDKGLTDALQPRQSGDFVDSAPPDDLVQPTRVPNLWVLPRGADTGDLASLLHSPELSFLLQRYRRTFDVVLIDTPPMLLYSDARVIGRMADGAVMVIRANTRTREELKTAYLRLVQDQIPVLGTILNDWKMDPRMSRSYGRYYQAYQQERV